MVTTLQTPYIRAGQLAAFGAALLTVHYVTGIQYVFWIGWVVCLGSGVPIFRVELNATRIRAGILFLVGLLHVTTYFLGSRWDAILGMVVTVGLLAQFLVLLWPLTNPFKRFAFLPVILIFGGTLKVAFSDPSSYPVDFPTYPFLTWYGLLLGVSYLFLGVMLLNLKSISLPRGAKQPDMPESIL